MPQPDVALGAGEGQQPAQGLLGRGQQHRHGRPLGTVRPVRPALVGYGQEGRLVLEPGQLPDEPVGRPRGQREGRLAAEGLWVAGVVGDVEQQVAAHVRADEVALRWAWTAVSWATPSAAYTSRQGVLTASEVIRSGLSPVLAQR